MDPLGAISPIVEGCRLPTWQDVTPPDYPSNSEANELVTEPKFPVRTDLNQKVSLWSGFITNLQVDAIVNPTNETLNDKNPVSTQIFTAAGSELAQTCKTELKVCRTGEAKITEAFALPARFVVHTVGPRYNIKYQTAADSALYNCYRNSLLIAREHKLSSIAFPIIYLPKRGFPPDQGAHLAIRTVRRFLENYGDQIERVVFIVSDTHEIIYRDVMCLYFPRNKVEGQFFIKKLPKNIGNEMGEPVIEERGIRISEKPIKQTEDNLADAHGGDDNIIETEHVGKHAFATMEGDHDTMSHERLQGRSPEETRLYEQQKVYQRWVKRGKTQDFSDFKKLRMIFHSGYDLIGRPVVVFIGKRYSDSSIDSDGFVGYACGLLDRLVNQEYTMVYFDTTCLQENHPPTSFVKYVYGMIDEKYHKNIKALHIVHPTLRTKFTTWWFTTFTAPELKDKVHYVTGVEYLYDSISPEQLDIPQFIMDADAQINGENYYTAWKPQSSTDL